MRRNLNSGISAFKGGFWAAVTLAMLAANNSHGAIQLVPLSLLHGVNGIDPHGKLLRGTNGDFYGVTFSGGHVGQPDQGTVFEMSRAGTVKTLVLFNGTNGSSPWGGLVLDSNGNFYGTTQYGGPNDCGSIFKMSPNGQFTNLAFFNLTNGNGPGAMILSQDGNFYGTTEGQFRNSGSDNYGTIFKLTADGIQTLFSFQGTNGADPVGAIVEDADGNFYGTTSFGGASFLEQDGSLQNRGYGTVFKLAHDGTLVWSVSFDGLIEYNPSEGLVHGADGNFYGTTLFGGFNGTGAIFKVTPDGKLTTLYSFSPCANGGENSDGACPGALTPGKDGCLYGVTALGGTSYRFGGGGIGTVFKITTNGVFTTLCSFGERTRPAYRLAFPNAVVQDEDGTFFGTTYYGGVYPSKISAGMGTAYALEVVRPVLTITKPRSGTQAKVPGITVVGKCQAQAAIAGVEYQLNDGQWTAAATLNGWANWSASVQLTPGTNVFRAYAVDSAGDASGTNVLTLGFGN